MKNALLNKLLEVAEGDTDVLRSLDSRGDDFRISRDVEFVLFAETKEVAQNAADTVNDFKYGVADVHEEDGRYCVLVIIHMPILQNAILSISGFMECLAQTLGLQYDGWGCMVQRSLT